MLLPCLTVFGVCLMVQEGHEFFIIETGAVVCTKTANGRSVEVCDPLGTLPSHTLPHPRFSPGEEGIDSYLPLQHFSD